MGSGLVGGPLTGSPPTGSNIAPSGQSAVLAGPLGAGATDVVTKAGSTAADGSVNSAAELLRIATGIGGTEVKYVSFTKAKTTHWGNNQMLVWDNGGANTWQMDPNISALTLRFGVGASAYLTLRGSDGYTMSGYGFELRDSSLTTVYIKTSTTGRIDQSGTDSTGTPGAATIDKPTGKSAIAAGASSVVITNALCSAASRVMMTMHSRDATGLLPIVVPGAGSFTVSVTANATAAMNFSWEVSNII